MSAEQDNRVQFPNGTAAVSAWWSFHGESRSLGNREGETFRKGRNLLCKGTSQKTYESVLLLLAIYKGDACRGKSAAVHLCAVVLLFFGGNVMSKKMIALVVALCLLVAALAVAFAIAFGLGGKEFAFKTLKKLEEKKEEQ